MLRKKMRQMQNKTVCAKQNVDKKSKRLCLERRWDRCKVLGDGAWADATCWPDASFILGKKKEREKRFIITRKWWFYVVNHHC